MSEQQGTPLEQAQKSIEEVRAMTKAFTGAAHKMLSEKESVAQVKEVTPERSANNKKIIDRIRSHGIPDAELVNPELNDNGEYKVQFVSLLSYARGITWWDRAKYWVVRRLLGGKYAGTYVAMYGRRVGIDEEDTTWALSRVFEDELDQMEREGSLPAMERMFDMQDLANRSVEAQKNAHEFYLNDMTSNAHPILIESTELARLTSAFQYHFNALKETGAPLLWEWERTDGTKEPKRDVVMEVDSTDVTKLTFTLRIVTEEPTLAEEFAAVPDPMASVEPAVDSMEAAAKAIAADNERGKL